MIDLAALQLVLGALSGWLDHRERQTITYLIEENRLLRRQLGGRRPRLTDDERRRLAAYRVGRTVLREIATIATPGTLLRWHRQLIARKWTYATKGRRRSVLFEIRQLAVRMATENPSWGYTRSRVRSRTSAIAWAVDHSADPEGGGSAVRSGAPELVADVFERALERYCGCRLL